MFYLQLGDRQFDEIPLDILEDVLENKISYGLLNTAYLNCNDEQREIVAQTATKVRELSGCSNKIMLGFTYIIVLTIDKNSCIVPILRTKKYYGDTIFFVEQQPGRVYEGWEDYLYNNKLPECDMCYPVDGYYVAENGHVKIGFKRSPSCNKTFSIIDTVSTVVGTASTGLLAVSVLCPLVLPVVIGAGAITGASAIYGTTRGVTQIVDRSSHHETIGLGDPASISLWVNTVSSALGGVMVGGAAIVPRVLTTGTTVALATATVCEILSYTSLAVNGFGVVAHVVQVILKYINGRLSIDDLNSFISSCFFIGNLIVTTSMAHNIIHYLTQQPSRLLTLFKMAHNTTFQMVKTVIQTGSMVVSEAIALLTGSHVAMFLRYIEMPKTAQILNTVTSTLRDFSKGRVNSVQFCLDMHRLISNHAGQFICEIKDALEKLSGYFGIPLKFVSVNGQHLFSDSSGAIALEINSSIDESVSSLQLPIESETKDCSVRLIELAKELGSKFDCISDAEFVTLCSLLAYKISNRCAAKISVARADGILDSSEDRKRIFSDVVGEIRNNSSELKYEFFARMKNSISQKGKIFRQPVCTADQSEMYTFETNYQFRQFNQFIHDAAVELLKIEDIFSEAEFYLRDALLIVHSKSAEKSVVFYYEPERRTNSVVGLAVLTNLSLSEV